MNSENSETTDPRRLLLNLTDKINLIRTDKYVALSNLSSYFTLYIIEKYETVTDNPSIRIYINNIENRITFKIKTGYYLELLMPKKTKLLGSTKSKINKDKNGEIRNHSFLI